MRNLDGARETKLCILPLGGGGVQWGIIKPKKKRRRFFGRRPELTTKGGLDGIVE